MFLGRKRLAALVAVGALAVSGCGGSGDSKESASGALGGACGKLESTSVKLGIPLNTYTLAPVYNALDGGLFKKHGVNVELVVLTGGTTPQAALLGGSVDMVHTGLNGLLIPVEQGVKAKAIWGGILATPYDLYAKSTIGSVADMKGKSLHITSLAADQGTLVQHYLSENGLTVKDVTLQQGGGSPVGLKGLEAGATDVSVLVPPTTFLAEDKGFKRVAAMRDYVAEYPMHMVQAMQNYIDKNPCTIKAFLRGLSEGTAMTKTDKAGTAERLTKFAEVPKEYANRTVESFQGQMFEDGRLPSKEALDKFWKIYTAVGVVKGEIPQDKWFDKRFVSSFDTWKSS